MNDKDERAHRPGPRQATSGSGAPGASGGRRRRRGRGRSQRGTGTTTTASTGGEATAASTPRPAGGAEGSREAATRPRRRRRRQGGGAGSTTSQRSGGRRGQRGGGRRRSAARSGKGGRGGNRRGGHPRKNAAAASHLDTRRETSAGGLVVSGLAEAVATDGSVDLSRVYVALIGRLDRRRRLLWSMPKGHVELEEDHRTTAQREVWEETGISGEVFADLGTIDYWFVSEGVRIHKTVHHYLLRYVDGYLNDEDPEVTEVSWIPVHQLIEHLAYADERKLARVAHDILPDLARAEKRAGRHTPR
ncbi:NUDIX hydrolase [Corynebacterium sp. zg-331]|uniref:NUDIX hydrolase n=1 Tax=unclassified Corynebacterium TaxID=2624378 RepID=UPI00128BD39C|nr:MULTISPECIES: NUDIX hydrolase [unclassified Corynebacterium]MBC3186495.1 NUDIX hydrolase [Corynebacterium sp. zg-331]MPV52980.1 NUDIX domain-containing protein [Corynebacterium sp. zg331]